jgi:hypothetical protein
MQKIQGEISLIKSELEYLFNLPYIKPRDFTRREELINLLNSILMEMGNLLEQSGGDLKFFKKRQIQDAKNHRKLLEKFGINIAQQGSFAGGDINFDGFKWVKLDIKNDKNYKNDNEYYSKFCNNSIKSRPILTNVNQETSAEKSVLSSSAQMKASLNSLSSSSAQMKSSLPTSLPASLESHPEFLNQEDYINFFSQKSQNLNIPILTIQKKIDINELIEKTPMFYKRNCPLTNGKYLPAVPVKTWEELHNLYKKFPLNLLFYIESAGHFALFLPSISIFPDGEGYKNNDNYTLLHGNIGRVFHCQYTSTGGQVECRPFKFKDCKFGISCTKNMCQYYHDPLYCGGSDVRNYLNNMSRIISVNKFFATCESSGEAWRTTKPESSNSTRMTTNIQNDTSVSEKIDKAEINHSPTQLINDINSAEERQYFQDYMFHLLLCYLSS